MECSVDECSVDECSVDECSVDEGSVAEGSVAECSVAECSVDECSVHIPTITGTLGLLLCREVGSISGLHHSYDIYGHGSQWTCLGSNLLFLYPQKEIPKLKRKVKESAENLPEC